MRPMANDLPRASTNFCITGRHNGVLYNNTMECSSRLVLALCRFPDFGFSDHTFSGTARHRFTPGILLLVPIVGNSDRSLLHHEPLIRLFSQATHITNKQTNKQRQQSSCSHLSIHSKSEDPDPNYPAKKLNFPQICPKMPQNGPKITQNGPKWPKYDPKWPKMALE